MKLTRHDRKDGIVRFFVNGAETRTAYDSLILLLTETYGAKVEKRIANPEEILTFMSIPAGAFSVYLDWTGIDIRARSTEDSGAVMYLADLLKKV